MWYNKKEAKKKEVIYMFNSKYNEFLTVLLVIAIIGILALLGYFGWSVYNKYYINAKAEEAASGFETSVGNKDNNNNDDGERIDIGNVEDGESIYKPSDSRK